MSDVSIVEYFAEHEGYKCGYCKSPDTNYSHGLWAHSLIVDDYQDLIDRGWRRSGKYCYKPTMDLTCCPMYTIKCSVQNFQPTKSQKKVLKRMTRFLAHGKMNEKEMEHESSDNTKSEESCCDYIDAKYLEKISKQMEANSENMKVSDSINKSDMDVIMDSATSQSDSKAINSDNAKMPTNSKTDEKESKCKDQVLVKIQPSKGLGADPNKPQARKAKDIRRERKLQKEKDQSGTKVPKPEGQKKTKEKSLEDFLNDTLVDKPAHKLEMRLVQSDPRTCSFDQSLVESYQVYKNYQTSIHKDAPDKCTEKQFLRFLSTSPLQEEPSDNLPCGYGSFHQQYLLDGTIIAVGVVDILPHCVSSVYLFYDPKYSFLSLGTYAALREIAFTRELSRLSAELNSYYMGFYIHSCPKMKYKAHYYPSYLLCPETYTWQEYEKCAPKLDQTKYCRLEEDPQKSDENGGEVDWNSLLVLNGRKIRPYNVYRLTSTNADDAEVKQYATFVGKKVYSRMLLYRN